MNERNKRLGWLKRRQVGLDGHPETGHTGRVSTFGPGPGGHGD